MEQISVFKSNKSQAVRPPKPVALCESGTQAGVITQGNARLIVPGDKNRDSWFDAEDVSNGFMSVRDQPLLSGTQRTANVLKYLLDTLIKNRPQVERMRFARHRRPALCNLAKL